MIKYFELNNKLPEFHEAYDVIGVDIDPEFVEPEDYVRERFRIQEEGAKNEEELNIRVRTDRDSRKPARHIRR